MPATGQRREVSRREVAWLTGVAALISTVMHWPLILHLGRDVPKDLGDPIAQAWQPSWGGHALFTQPLEFFQSNQFWPLPDTLAFSDALIGYAPLGAIGSGVEAAIVRYDLFFLAAYALAFAAAYLLARELGLGPGASALAGMAFAFAPFRLEQDGHLQVISSGGIPLALAVGLRGYRRARPGWVYAGWLVVTWQLLIGFTLGLPTLYLLSALGLLAAILWQRRGRPQLDRRLLAATGAGVLTLLVVTAVVVQPYLQVRDDHPETERSVSDVAEFSGPLSVFVTAPEENFIWGPASASIRDNLQNVPEKTLFPGLVILILGLAGSTHGSPLRRPLRLGLLAGVIGVSILALGFRESGGLLWPYRVLYEFLPGFDGIRVPGRLVTFSSLGLALLAAAGAARLGARLSAAKGRRWALGATAVLALAVAVEGAGLPFDPFDHRKQPSAPLAPANFSQIAAPQLHLPAERAADNRRYLLWSVDGFPEVVNGRSSLQPALTAEIIAAARGFPDATSAAALRELGVRSVVLHRKREAGTPWEGASERPLGKLALNRRELGDVVVYEIRSESAG